MLWAGVAGAAHDNCWAFWGVVGLIQLDICDGRLPLDNPNDIAMSPPPHSSTIAAKFPHRCSLKKHKGQSRQIWCIGKWHNTYTFVAQIVIFRVFARTGWTLTFACFLNLWSNIEYEDRQCCWCKESLLCEMFFLLSKFLFANKVS